MVAKSTKELRVYQQAYALAMEICDVSEAWPTAETYSLTDQIRRSSRSVSVNFKEAWAKRRYIRLISLANLPVPMLRTVKRKPGLILHWIANICLKSSMNGFPSAVRKSAA